MVFVVLVGWKFYNRNEDSDVVLAEAKALIAELAIYEANAEYLDRITKQAHDSAFQIAYDMGGRRKAASLDEDAYMLALLDRMLQICRMDRKDDIAVVLQDFRDAIADGLAEEKSTTEAT